MTYLFLNCGEYAIFKPIEFEGFRKSGNGVPPLRQNLDVSATFHTFFNEVFIA